MKREKLKFDAHGRCNKCNCRVVRLAKTGTWHHVNIEDYKKCGYVGRHIILIKQSLEDKEHEHSFGDWDDKRKDWKCRECNITRRIFLEERE